MQSLRTITDFIQVASETWHVLEMERALRIEDPQEYAEILVDLYSDLADSLSLSDATLLWNKECVEVARYATLVMEVHRTLEHHHWQILLHLADEDDTMVLAEWQEQGGWQ